MALYFNMEKNLLRNGGRKAPAMSEGDLMDLFEAALNRFKNDDFDEDPRMDTDMEGLDILFYDAMTGYPGEAPFQKVKKDLDKVDVDWENIGMEKVVTGSNGVPAIRGWLCGDWEMPVVFFLYWDVKTFRAYIPTYGNSYNRYCKSAFGSEDQDAGNIYRKYHVVCGPAPADDDEEDFEYENDCDTAPDDDDEEDFRYKNTCDSWGGRHKDGNDLFYEQAGIDIHLEDGEEIDVELDEKNYDFFCFQNVCANTSACLEDFSNRVVSTGEATNEDLRKWHRALGKLLDEPLEDPYIAPPCPIPDIKLFLSIQNGAVVVNNDFKLELRWENGEVVFVDADPDNPVSDDVLKAEIDGLELTGPHRGRYKVKRIEPVLVKNEVADKSGLPEMFEFLRLYSEKLNLAVEYGTLLQIMEN